LSHPSRSSILEGAGREWNERELQRQGHQRRIKRIGRPSFSAEEMKRVYKKCIWLWSVDSIGTKCCIQLSHASLASHDFGF